MVFVKHNKVSDEKREEDMMKLHLNRPASCWAEGFPIGNGRMGAVIFGETGQEHVQLNEDSVWYGGPIDRLNPEALEALPKVQKMIWDGRIPEAEDLMTRCFSGLPQSQRPYQTAGEMTFCYDGDFSDPREYQRALNLAEGMVQVSFRQGDTLYEKEYFASYPAQVIVIHMSAKGEDRITFSMLLTRGRFYDHSGKIGDDTVWIDGNLGKGGSDFVLMARAETLEGRVYAQGETLRVEDAKEVTLYLAMETSFYHGESYKDQALKRLDSASGAGYQNLRKEHIEDYRKLFDRVSFRLTEDESQIWEAEELLQSASLTDVKQQQRLAELYFQYGRYLLISCSRPESQTATLQGIWNSEMAPPWDSKYTININIEMNYWPAEICNLSEFHEPLFDLLKRMLPNGQKVAREMYGCRGFVAHHNTDIWGDCVPQDIYIPATYWVMGAAWLCTHIWRHYLYTRNEEFLREMYPVLEEAVVFFQDFLTVRDGVYYTCPSVSPENTYILPDGTSGRICAGASMDSQILKDLFDGYLKASEVIGKEDAVVQAAREIFHHLPEPKVGKYGQIMEWREDYEEIEPGHRHISQLYALHPSYQITVDGTPELAAAAERTLERRLQYGGRHTGWSCAWIVNFYGRLGNGEKAWDNLLKLWSNSTFPNFMDNHPMPGGAVFQIDGNLGATAAIAELLVQSNEERTLLLPALPSAWSQGEIKGLKIVGGAEISLKWKNGKLEEYSLLSIAPLKVRLVYQSKEWKIELHPGELYQERRLNNDQER